MQKLYQLLNDEEVLEAVIEAISRSRSSLLLVQGEDDDSQIQPDNRYFELLRDLQANGIIIRRYYFGNKESFKTEQNLHPNISYAFAGSMENYQRAIIIDGKQAFFKIGKQFAFSENAELIKTLENYLEQCCLNSAGNSS